MTYGLQLWDATGALTFDSSLAAGGVCLGLYTISTGGQTISFPDLIGVTGVVLYTGYSTAAPIYTSDSVPGYLRFVFPSLSGGASVVLFAK